MAKYSEANQINSIISSAKSVVVVQADNPDTDSLASALALEHILEELGKKVYLYCGVDLPSYLRYLPGSDRVNSTMPNLFDASVIVDTSSDTLLEQLERSGAKSWLAGRPNIVIDHHTNEPSIKFASVVLSSKAVATAEVIYELAKQLNWNMNIDTKELLAIGILSDSLGLASEATTARSVHIIGEIVESGISLAKIESARRETMRREPELIYYKAELLKRIEFHNENQIATLVIPWDEIEKYSPLYNPSMLAIEDMRLAKGTDLAICFKVYKDGKITAKIRSNFGKGISDKLAEKYGGGGHPYASGFKVTDGRSLEEVKSDTVKSAIELLKEFTNSNDKTAQ